MANDTKLFEELPGALLYVWKFVRFSESRWCTVGVSCRTLVAGLLTGLESLVARIMADKSASKWDIGGFSHLGPEAKRFVAVSALASDPSDAALTELLHDDRLAMAVDGLETLMTEELEWLAAIPDTVWGHVGRSIAMPGSKLRSDTLGAAHTSVAYVTIKVVRVARQYPWSLTQGDIHADLDALACLDEPEEATMRKIWQLLRLGYNRGRIVEGLQLLADCSWSTTPVEQQHGAASSMRKSHSEYGPETLTTRAFILMLRQLLAPNEDDVRQQQLEDKVSKLSKKNPRRHEWKACVREAAHGPGQDMASLWEAEGIPAHDRTCQGAGPCSAEHAEAWC